MEVKNKCSEGIEEGLLKCKTNVVKALKDR